MWADNRHFWGVQPSILLDRSNLPQPVLTRCAHRVSIFLRGFDQLDGHGDDLATIRVVIIFEPDTGWFIRTLLIAHVDGVGTRALVDEMSW